jgi:hypothetical protein
VTWKSELLSHRVNVPGELGKPGRQRNSYRAEPAHFANILTSSRQSAKSDHQNARGRETRNAQKAPDTVFFSFISRLHPGNPAHLLTVTVFQPTICRHSSLSYVNPFPYFRRYGQGHCDYIDLDSSHCLHGSMGSLLGQLCVSHKINTSLSEPSDAMKID